MRIGSIIFWLSFAAFLALPVIGYQYYLKGLRKQTDAIGVGTDQIKNTYKKDLQALTKRLDPNAPVQGAAEKAAAAGDKSKKLFDQMQKTQQNQQKKNPLLQK